MIHRLFALFGVVAVLLGAASPAAAVTCPPMAASDMSDCGCDMSGMAPVGAVCLGCQLSVDTSQVAPKRHLAPSRAWLDDTATRFSGLDIRPAEPPPRYSLG